jgi:hypothetical protein
MIKKKRKKEKKKKLKKKKKKKKTTLSLTAAGPSQCQGPWARPDPVGCCRVHVYGQQRHTAATADLRGTAAR